MRFAALMLLTFFGLIAPAEAQFSGGRVVRTSPQLEAGCDAGRAQDFGDLGQRYATANGVPRNDKKAASLFQRACDGGDGFGCAKLASLYDSGEGVKKDSGKAALYADRGCKAKDPFGCLLLGATYVNGAPGYPKDTRRAESLLRESCFGGNAANAAPDAIAKLACPALAKLTAKPACETKTFSGNRTGTTCYGKDGRWQVTMAPTSQTKPNAQLSSTRNSLTYDDRVTEYLFRKNIIEGKLSYSLSGSEFSMFCLKYADGSESFKNKITLSNLDRHIGRLIPNIFDQSRVEKSMKDKIKLESDEKLKLIALACMSVYPKIYPFDSIPTD